MTETEIAPTPRNSYSFSRIKSFRQCPARYRFRYLQGLKEAFRSIESYLGNSVHDVLEWLYGERMKGSSPDLESTLQKFAQQWSEEMDDSIVIIRVDETEQTYVQLGRSMLEQFHRETFARDRSRTVSLEQRVSVKIADDIVFSGFADRVGRTEKGRLFVIDYKTSRSEGDSSEFSEGLQAPLYAASVLRHHGEDEALAGYHYLRHGTTRWQHVDPDRAQFLLDRFEQLVRETEAATEFPARPGILCAWCGFNAECRDAEVSPRFAGGLEFAEKSGRRLL